jgi:hypothetical protein
MVPPKDGFAHVLYQKEKINANPEKMPKTLYHPKDNLN